MGSELLQYSLPWLIAALGACLVLVFARFVIGPTQLDRLAAFEAATLILLCLAGLVGLWLETIWFFDFILVLSLVGFISTVAVANYIKGMKDDG